jgi:hypothetical protein
MKRIITLALFAVLFTGLFVRANASDPDIDKLKRATAIVATYFYDKNYDVVCYKMGTGFFIEDPDKRLFVTALHVVSSDVPEEAESSVTSMEIKISYGYEPKEEVDPENPKNFKSIFSSDTKTKYWAVDEDNDLIVFDLSKTIFVSPKEAMEYLKKKKDLPEVGDFVATMGHTFGVEYFNFAEGKITKTGCPLISNFPNIAGGNSGGCIVNKDYQCVGVLSSGYKTTSIQKSICSTLIYPLVLKLESSSKGEEKTFKEYFPPDDYKGQAIMGAPKFKFGNK